MNRLSKDDVNLPDGTYDALWTAYTMKILVPNEGVETVKTIDGVRGKNCKTSVKIIDKNLYRA